MASIGLEEAQAGLIWPELESASLWEQVDAALIFWLEPGDQSLVRCLFSSSQRRSFERPALVVLTVLSSVEPAKAVVGVLASAVASPASWEV